MKSAGRLEDIQRLSPRVVIHPTSAPRDAIRIARELTEAGAPMIVAAGGDGTVNEVINGMMAVPGAETVLGILPTGTMNVFARDLGLPCRSLELCWEMIASGKSRTVDLWTANDQCFAQLAGAGLDAAVIAGTTWESKKRLGPFSYVINALRLLRGDSPVLRVEAPDRPPVEGRVVFMGNGKSYGGPFRFFPAGDFTDGMLEVIVMQQHNIPDLLRLGLALAKGSFSGLKGITTFQTTSLTITAPGEVPFQLDGELCGHTPVQVRRHPQQLRVIGG